MQKVKELFVKYKLTSKEELMDLYLITPNTKDVYELRAIALDNALDPKEWARVLTSIAKRRGYRSNNRRDVL